MWDQTTIYFISLFLPHGLILSYLSTLIKLCEQLVSTVMCLSSYPFCSVQSLSHVQLFETPWTAARQTSLSIVNSQSLLKLMSIELVMPPTISVAVISFSSYLQSFPAKGSFPVSQLFVSGGQSIGASASVFPMNIQD